MLGRLFAAAALVAALALALFVLRIVVSVALLAISVWIRLQMQESPAFQKMKAEGTHSKAPLSEAFGQWKNAKFALARVGISLKLGVGHALDLGEQSCFARLGRRCRGNPDSVRLC